MLFYSSLFSSEPINLPSQQRCLDSVGKFLSPSQSISCEGFLSSEELLNSVRSRNTGKSPCRWNFIYIFGSLWLSFCSVLLIDVLLTANYVPQ